MIRVAAAISLLATAAMAESPLPFKLGGDFTLTDQHGQTRTQADPNGLPQLLFFGYANCEQICSAALPMMADVADTLAASGTPVTPVLITVDPARDTVATLGPALQPLHPDFIGLTGDAAALQQAYDAFSVETELLFDSPEGPVYSHGSFLYLLAADGRFLTLIPPILTPEAASGIAAKYLPASG